MALDKVRVQLLDKATGDVLKEVDILTSADAVKFEDGETFQQKLEAGTLKGQKGDTGATGATGATGTAGATGQRGTQWYNGTGITGTSTTATVFSGSGVSTALVGDMYLNTSTGYVYTCTVAGAASVAKWVYSGSIKGSAGSTGATGATGATGPKGETGDTVRIGTTYESGTEAKLFFKVM